MSGASSSPTSVGRPEIHTETAKRLHEMIVRRQPAGSMLDSELKLSKSLGVSRTVVRKALGSLRRQGMIKTVPGKGHLVLDPAQTRARTMRIAVVVGAHRPFSSDFPGFLAPIIEGLNAELAPRGHRIFVETVGAGETPVPEVIAPYRDDIDAVLFVPMANQSPAQMLEDLAEQLPVVVANRASGMADVPSVCVDHVGGMRKLAQYLCDIGHRRMAYLGGTAGLAFSERRRKAFVSTVGEALGDRAAVSQQLAGLGHEQVVAATQAMLQQQPSVIVCESKTNLPVMLNEIQRHDLRIPQDISVACFDDSHWAQHADPPVSVVRQPLERVGQLAGQQLLDAVAGQTNTEPIVLACDLILRESIAAYRPSLDKSEARP